MSNLRQAAQQALKEMDDHMYRADTHEFYEAKEALRAALAEPEQEPFMVVAPECAERGCMAHDDRVDGSGVVLHFREKQEPQTTHWEGCEAVHPECKVTPRKPLTDDEMRECAQAMNAEPLAEGWPELIKFARAIERAHGIGEQT